MPDSQLKRRTLEGPARQNPRAHEHVTDVVGGRAKRAVAVGLRGRPEHVDVSREPDIAVVRGPAFGVDHVTGDLTAARQRRLDLGAAGGLDRRGLVGDERRAIGARDLEHVRAGWDPKLERAVGTGDRGVGADHRREPAAIRRLRVDERAGRHAVVVVGDRSRDRRRAHDCELEVRRVAGDHERRHQAFIDHADRARERRRVDARVIGHADRQHVRAADVHAIRAARNGRDPRAARIGGRADLDAVRARDHVDAGDGHGAIVVDDAGDRDGVRRLDRERGDVQRVHHVMRVRDRRHGVTAQRVDPRADRADRGDAGDDAELHARTSATTAVMLSLPPREFAIAIAASAHSSSSPSEHSCETSSSVVK